MKYFLLGAFSSGFFVYGIALTYGYAGSMGFAQIADAVASNAGGREFLLGGIALMAVGLLFKIGGDAAEKAHQQPGAERRSEGEIDEYQSVQRIADAQLRDDHRKRDE